MSAILGIDMLSSVKGSHLKFVRPEKVWQRFRSGDAAKYPAGCSLLHEPCATAASRPTLGRPDRASQAKQT